MKIPIPAPGCLVAEISTTWRQVLISGVLITADSFSCTYAMPTSPQSLRLYCVLVVLLHMDYDGDGFNIFIYTPPNASPSHGRSWELVNTSAMVATVKHELWGLNFCSLTSLHIGQLFSRHNLCLTNSACNARSPQSRSIRTVELFALIEILVRGTF